MDGKFFALTLASFYAPAEVERNPPKIGSRDQIAHDRLIKTSPWQLTT